jgi:hypothetical protein
MISDAHLHCPGAEQCTHLGVVCRDGHFHALGVGVGVDSRPAAGCALHRSVEATRRLRGNAVEAAPP